jgi:phenylalanine-4-hydroxylase
MKNIVNKLMIYLKGIYGGENDIVGIENTNFSKGIDLTGKVTRLTNLETISVLDFLIALIQIFPIEYINDINYELNNLLINEVDETIYVKVLSVIELSFSTKMLNQELTKLTNFELVFDNETVVGKKFFSLLAQRKFPSTMFIRTMQALDYLSEPDIFHDIFGHCAFLADERIATIIQMCGEIGLKCIENKISTKFIGRLYWYSIEFGLLKAKHKGGLQILGGGIISSFAEAPYSINSTEPMRFTFEPELVMRTDYSYNEIQKVYFVLESLEALIEYLKSFDVEILRQEKFKNSLTPNDLQIEFAGC